MNTTHPRSLVAFLTKISNIGLLEEGKETRPTQEDDDDDDAYIRRTFSDHLSFSGVPRLGSYFNGNASLMRGRSGFPEVGKKQREGDI